MTDPYPYSPERAAHLRVLVGLCDALGVPWTALDRGALFGGALPDFGHLLDLADEYADHDERAADRRDALRSWREMRGYVTALWGDPSHKDLIQQFGGYRAARAFGLGVARVEAHALGWRPVAEGGQAAVVLPITAPGPGGVRHCTDMLAMRLDLPPVSREGITDVGLVGADAAYVEGPLAGPEIRLFVSPQTWLADWNRYRLDWARETVRAGEGRPEPRPGSHAYLALGDVGSIDWEAALRDVERVVCPERDFAEWLHARLRRPRPKRHLPKLLVPKEREMTA